MPFYLTWRASAPAYQIMAPVNFRYPSFFFNLITPQWVGQTKALSLWLYLRSAYTLVSFSAQSPLRGLASFWERHRTSSLCFKQAGFATLTRRPVIKDHTFSLTSPSLLGGLPCPLTFTFSLPVTPRTLAWLRCSYAGDARCAQWLWVTNPTRRRASRAVFTSFRG